MRSILRIRLLIWVFVAGVAQAGHGSDSADGTHSYRMIQPVQRNPAPKHVAHTQKLRIAFLTGVRYVDGFGDLSLNKYLIDAQVAALRKKYGGNVEINVVYLNEVPNGYSEEQLKSFGAQNFQGIEGVKKIYNGERYDSSTARLSSSPSRGVGKPYLSRSEGIRFWSEDAFKGFVLNNPGAVDLAFMASETSATMSGQSRYHLPDWLHGHVNTVAFKEYSGLAGEANADQVDVVLNDGQAFVSVKVATGPKSAGLILDDHPDFATKKEILSLIRNDLKTNGGRFENPLGSGAAKVDTVLQQDPWFVPSYLSKMGGETEAETAAIRSILWAYFHSKLPGSRSQRPYVVFSNGFPAANLQARVTEELEREGFGGHAEDLRRFVEERVLVLRSRSKPLSTREIRGMFNPDNGALFVQVAGYATLSDALSVGSVPTSVHRRYHRGFADEYLDAIRAIVEKKRGSVMAQRVIDFLNSQYSIDKQAHEEVELQPVFREVARELRQELNLNSYVSDVVDVFYRAKSLNSSHLTQGVAEELKDDPGATGNRFLKTMAPHGETLQEALEARGDPMTRVTQLVLRARSGDVLARQQLDRADLDSLVNAISSRPVEQLRAEGPRVYLLLQEALARHALRKGPSSNEAIERILIGLDTNDALEVVFKHLQRFPKADMSALFEGLGHLDLPRVFRYLFETGIRELPNPTVKLLSRHYSEYPEVKRRLIELLKTNELGDSLHWVASAYPEEVDRFCKTEGLLSPDGYVRALSFTKRLRDEPNTEGRTQLFGKMLKDPSPVVRLNLMAHWSRELGREVTLELLSMSLASDDPSLWEECRARMLHEIDLMDPALADAALQLLCAHPKFSKIHEGRVFDSILRSLRLLTPARAVEVLQALSRVPNARISVTGFLREPGGVVVGDPAAEKILRNMMEVETKPFYRGKMGEVLAHILARAQAQAPGPCVRQVEGLLVHEE